MNGAWGEVFLIANGPAARNLFRLARAMCIPFSLIGMWVCFRWGTELTSVRGGLIASTLWCFSPNTIGHGALMTTDIAATSLGLLAAWRFAAWLEHRTSVNVFLAGAALGLTLLTKLYWSCLFAIWPVLLMVDRARTQRWNSFTTDCLQLLAILLIGLNVLNLGYFFSGTGTKLGEFSFYSRALSGELRVPGENLPGNRFTDSWMGGFPVPLPKDYVSGIDLQKLDFEQGKWSYFLGEVKVQGGWLHYYAVGLFLKVPLATWLLCLLGIAAMLRSRDVRTTAIRLLPLAVPVAVLFVIVSSQTGMNRHVRYVFPTLPLVYLIGGLAGRLWLRRSVLLVGFSVLSSLWVFPHSLSFFNVSIGGADQGFHYLIDSNLDWGQDLYAVRDWLDEHPAARPAYVASIHDVPLSSFGIETRSHGANEIPAGWHIVSRHQRFHPDGRLRAFKSLDPVDQIGKTFDIYHVERTIRIRIKKGLR